MNLNQQWSRAQKGLRLSKSEEYCNPNYFWRISNVSEVSLFICSVGKKGGNYLRWRSLPPFFFVYFSLRKDGGAAQGTESTDIWRSDYMDDTTREHWRLRPIVGAAWTLRRCWRWCTLRRFGMRGINMYLSLCIRDRECGGGGGWDESQFSVTCTLSCCRESNGCFLYVGCDCRWAIWKRRIKHWRKSAMNRLL